jgi:hypothetical protein
MIKKVSNTLIKYIADVFENYKIKTSVQFNPNTLVQITADFITTGPIQIKMSIDTRGDILKEDTDNILLEKGGAKLQLEQVV